MPQYPPPYPADLLGHPVFAQLSEGMRQIAELVRRAQGPQRLAQEGRPSSQGRSVPCTWIDGNTQFGLIPRPYTHILEAETDATPQTLIVEMTPPYADANTDLAMIRTSVRRGEGAQSDTNDGTYAFFDYLPPWGYCVPMSGGRITIDAALFSFGGGAVVGSTSNVSVSLAPGQPISAWEYDFNSGPKVNLGGGASYPLIPNRFARTLRMTLLSGAITGPVAMATIGQSVQLPAFQYNITTALAGGGGAVAIQWETVRAS